MLNGAEDMLTTSQTFLTDRHSILFLLKKNGQKIPPQKMSVQIFRYKKYLLCVMAPFKQN